MPGTLTKCKQLLQSGITEQTALVDGSEDKQIVFQRTTKTEKIGTKDTNIE